MQRWLIGFIMDGNSGGIDRYILNFTEQTRSEGVIYDFLTNEITAQMYTYAREHGSRLYAIPNLHHPVSQYIRIRRILAQEHYDAVYLNISTAIDCIAVLAAKHFGVKRVIVHSHSSGNDCEKLSKRILFDLLNHLFKPVIGNNATELCACSMKAGEWIFPAKSIRKKGMQVIYNAVDRNRFHYDPAVRMLMRRNHHWENDFLVGHVANFTYQKNHEFVLEILEELLKKEKTARLVLIGDGYKKTQIEELAKTMGIAERVTFAGRRTDVERFYQAFDAFILPSHFEGLPVVGVEAQSSGLPVFFSKTITREAKIEKKCHFLPVNVGAGYWAEQILKEKKRPRTKAEFLPEAEHYDLLAQRQQLIDLIRSTQSGKGDDRCSRI